MHIHQSGPYQGLPIYEPSLMGIREGGRATLVAHVTVWDEQGEHLCKGHLTRQFFKLRESLPKGTDCITVINARVQQIRGPVLTIDEKAKTLIHQPCTMQALNKISETCGGLGALGTGAGHAGFRITTVNEIQQSFCDELRKEGKCNVVQGDICKMPTVIQMHETGEGSAILAFGFSCQPFSSLGDNRQGQDERSASLTYGLYAAYLLQMKIVILECVTNALQSKFVKVGIQHYVNHTDAFRSDEVLELSDLWPSHRRRWWCVLSHPAIGKITLSPLPKLPQTPTMSDLMPKFMDLTMEEFDQLLLTQHEQSMFLSLSGGSHHQVLDINSTLQTALHSWGNQCIKCRCGCEREFSFQRLQSEGIHGALIFIHNSFPGKSLRHMSAREMAIFTGFPRTDGWTGDQRMLTSGVGQLASSIQAAWICGSIRQHLKDIKFLPPDEITSRSSVASVCFAVIELQQQWMGPTTTIEMEMFRESLGELLKDSKPPIASPFDTRPVPKGSILPQGEDKVGIESEKEGGLFLGNGVTLGSTPNSKPIEVESSDSPMGFTQAIVSQIEDIEKGMVAQKNPKIVDPKTGGIVAFASGKNQQVKRSFAETQEVSKGVNDTKEGSFIKEESRNDVHPNDASSLYQQICPADLYEDVTMIYHCQSRQAVTLKVSESPSFAELMKAEESLHGEAKVFHDILGRNCDKEKIIQSQVYITREQNHNPIQDLKARANSISDKPRWESLLIQGSAVANDEMEQYLQMVAFASKVESASPFVVDSLHDCSEVAKQWESQLDESDKTVITAIGHQHHWIPFVFVISGKSVQIITTEEGRQLWPMIGFFPQGSVHTRVGTVSQFPEDCGFQCISWLMTYLNQQPVVPMTLEEAIALRTFVWKKWYTREYHSTLPPHLFLGGHGSEIETAVCAILREHGVFMERVQERAKLIIQKLGHQAVTSALKNTRPWQALKQMANMQSPAVRLIQEDEFQRVLQDKTKDGNPVKTQKKQSNPKKPRTDPVVFQPKDVHIPDGVFVQADGSILGQIQVRQVHHAARGVVLVQEYEWAPFRGQKTISTEGLGFLVMAPYSHEVVQSGKEIRFPAQSTTTGEPILLSAVLIQHGNQEVGRFQPSQPQAIEQIETQTVKVLLYRDQCALEWKEIVPKPIKAVLSLLECLQPCDAPSCNCSKWHRESNDVDPIIDLWQRDFVNVHFQKTKPEQASIFTCSMRIAKGCLPLVMSQSGQDGVYIEPRQQDGKKMDETYHTVWLNKQTCEEARALQATAKMPVSLVRVTNRYGLRVEARFGPELHKALKPDTPFISSGEKIHFVVGPLPFGTTKKAMSKLFEQWSWVAQPLHPCGRSQDQKGLMWKVVAGSPPQHLVYTMAHGDLMVTRESAPPSKEVLIPQVEASKYTRTTCQTVEIAKEWDPWAAAASKLPSVSSKAPEITPAQIAAVEAKIESNLLSKMPTMGDAPMDSNEPRIAALEAQFRELKHSQQQCVDQQKQVSIKMDHLQQQVETQATTFQSCLEQQMSEQMKRIESLLNKRKATE